MGGVSTNHLRRRTTPSPSSLGPLWKLALCASLLAGVTAAAVDAPLSRQPDRINVERRNNVLELTWSDTEERLQGSLQPDMPHEGEPLKVLLNVGSFAGEAFDGPITLTLRQAGATHGQAVTVKREKGAVNWRAEFTPETTGPYQLDVSFRTTHLKVLHADFDVISPPVPRVFLWAMVGLFAMLALAYGLRSLLRKEPSSEPQPLPPETPAAPAAASSAEASSATAEGAPAPGSEKPSTL